MFERVLPIVSDEDVLRFVRGVIDADGGSSGAERLTWVLMLDDGDRPLPMAMPIEGVPVDPDPEDVARFAASLLQVVEGSDAARLLVVWERPGDQAVRMHEADWAQALARSGLPLRAQLLATEDGVRLLDPAFESIVAG